MSLYTYNSNTIYSTIVVQDDFVLGICLDSTNTTTITTFTTTHCSSSSGGEAAHKTASVRQALTGSETWQRLADGYRSAHQGKSFSGLPMNVLPGVSRESDGGHEVTDFGLSIELKRQRSVPVGNGASRKSDIPNEVGATFSDV